MGAPDPFVDRAWLDNHDYALLLDARYYLDDREGREAYVSGHIPGALYVDMDTELAGPAGSGGRHPLPAPAVFEQAMRELGISQDSVVVAYDDAGGFIAGRVWWMLDALGVEAYLLAGGIAAWPGELEVGSKARPGGGTLSIPEWPTDRFVDADYVAAAGREVHVIDSRAEARYQGAPNALDPRSGHVPGALSLPSTGNLVDSQPIAHDKLAQRFASAGLEANYEIVAYCGSGVSACLNLASLRRAGYENLRLYTGSWSEWAADESRPVETGAS